MGGTMRAGWVPLALPKLPSPTTLSNWRSWKGISHALTSTRKAGFRACPAIGGGRWAAAVGGLGCRVKVGQGA